VEGIKKGALSMAWYMRGGATYEDILNMSDTERKAINSIIESNLEVTKKSQLPLRKVLCHTRFFPIYFLSRNGN
jgi:hypothetical protein